MHSDDHNTLTYGKRYSKQAGKESPGDMHALPSAAVSGGHLESISRHAAYQGCLWWRHWQFDGAPPYSCFRGPYDDTFM